MAIYRLISADSIEELVYQRQIYKQQSSNIVMKGSHERRYFEGVQGVKGQEGELFGLVNLLGVKKKTALLRQNEKREQLRCAKWPALYFPSNTFLISPYFSVFLSLFHA